ncbi:MAG TPA: electron transport complex subunit RsxC [Methylophilaceae bacterium]|nr:electron transport complex subunit RsxC [Methylophilaceae bacterium]HQR61012.1 electron transport complex subunit RsxC [Methylophilaceae bacterium]
MISKLFKFHGGVHPPEHKLESTTGAIRPLPLGSPLVLPLRQHVGNLPKIRVQAGDRVLKGRLLAEAEGNISAAVHAPTSGTVVSIDEQLIPHPSGLPDVCITLQPDGEDAWLERKPVDWRRTDRRVLIASLRESGIVGMGGAAFPTQIKLRPSGEPGIKVLIINGAECEPYITCDDLLMRERADQIVKGIEVAQYLLGAERCIVGIEDNKPQAAEAMRAACSRSVIKIEVAVVPTLYPSGDARRLIHLLTHIEVPSDKRSTDVGVQVFNVATVVAVYRYFEFGEPALSRIVTVTGNVRHPGNFEVPLGTSVAKLLEAAGGALSDTNDLIMGGPMMGFSLPSSQVPVTKATNCIIAGAPKLFPALPPALPCIRCARCAEACPVSLQPQELYWFAKSDNFEKARDYQLFDCIECGCCSYVCPSHIPLVQYYRYAKSEIIALDRAKQAADLARERNEFRLARIEREKQERAAKHAQKTAGTKAETAGDEAKKAAIAAALERAKAQKAEVVPQNTESLAPAVQAEIAEIDARRGEALAEPEKAAQEKQES